MRGSGPNRNSQKRLERLVAAWEQASLGSSQESADVGGPDAGVVSNPGRRNRTPLTASEIDAIRTARANGESVLSICKKFGVHRTTVWEYTKKSNDHDGADPSR